MGQPMQRPSPIRGHALIMRPMTNMAPPVLDQHAIEAVQPAALQRQSTRLAGLSQAPWLHQEVGRRMVGKLDAIRLRPRHCLDWGSWLGGAQQGVAGWCPDADFWIAEPIDALRARSLQALEAQHKPGFWRGLLQPRRNLERQVILAVRPEELQAVSGWPDGGVDMLWANMALHAAPDLSQRLSFWHRALAPHGFLMCSGLGPDTLRELKEIYRDMGWGPCTQAFTDMHDIGDAIVHAGFAEPVMDMEHLTLTWPDAQHVLDELHGWGGNLACGRFAGCRTPRWRRRLLDALTERLRGSDGRLAMTVEVIYGHAIKPQPRIAVAPETRVSLSDMRQIVRQRPGR